MSKNAITWIVTVNYRTPDLVIASLQALALQVDALNGGKVIVVDNASGDGSLEKIDSAIKTRHWSTWVHLIQSDRNGGFAFGNNLGFNYAMTSTIGADYIMLLNPDAQVKPHAIKNLIAFMEEHPMAGIAGSQVQNAVGGIESSAHTFHSPIGELLDGAQLGVLSRYFSSYVVTPPNQYKPHVCDWVSGCSMIIRRKVIEDIGLMDEAFFLYFEEVDFFQRAAKAGWQTWYVPDSIVTHIEGASTGIKNIQRRPRYWYNSRRRYFVKHYGVKGLIAADILLTIGRLSFLLRRVFKLGAQGGQLSPKHFMADLLTSDLHALFSTQTWRT